MEIFQTILDIVYGVLEAFLLIMLLYQIYLTIFGLTRKTKDYADHDPKSRFLVLVPAHNEEKVIAGIIENLQHMEYPQELYDFYIIADNCTDRTADVARQMGAKVIETRRLSAKDPTGKPIALRKALEQIGNYQDRYDLMMVFDADNLMDPNMFLEINSQYLDKGKPELIQCYLGSKNQKGFVPWFYYISYTSTNRFLQLAKYHLGLNCSVGGTGFAIKTQYLYQRGGWTSMSLTEDLEIQIEATAEGGRVLWNHNVRIYDEKPQTIRASIRQRTRWAQGHFYVCFRNTGKILSSVLHRRISLAEGFSTLTYMYSLFPYLIASLQLVNNVVRFTIRLSRGAGLELLLESVLMGVIGLSIGFLPLYYMAEWMDNKKPFTLKTLPQSYVSFLVCMVVATVSQWTGLFRWRQQSQWVKTDHSITHLEGKDSHLPQGSNVLEEKN